MAAKPARLTTNRHGTFSLRWIVPVRLRDEHGRPREVRISLRTRDSHRARILALEFNLALERNKSMTLPFDPSTIAPWSLQAGNVKIEVTSAEDQKLFQMAMQDDPDLRAVLADALRSGMQPAEAIAAVVSQVKGAVGDATGVAQPKLLSAAISQYVGTRKVLSKNRRSTTGEKVRTLDLLLQHLESQGKDLARFSAHDLKRAVLVSHATISFIVARNTSRLVARRHCSNPAPRSTAIARVCCFIARQRLRPLGRGHIQRCPKVKLVPARLPCATLATPFCRPRSA